MLHSQPYLGQINQLVKVFEYKVELVCTDVAIKEVVQTLLSVHTYEEPAYEVYKILKIQDLRNK